MIIVPVCYFLSRVNLLWSHCKIFALQNFKHIKRNDILTQWNLIVNTFIG